jgi:hypothetical protein
MRNEIVFAGLLWFACLASGSPIAARPAVAAPAAGIRPGAAGDPGVVAKTAGRELRVARDGAIRAVANAGKPLPLLDLPGGFEVAEYLGARREARVLRPLPHPTRGGLAWSYDGAKLTLSVDIQETPGYLRFHGKLKDTSGKDRALIVAFTLPINAWGWTWWDDPDRVRRVTHGVRYTSYSFLGEKRDIPISRLPFATLADPASNTGLALAVPQHHPRISRFSCDADRGYRVEFNLGLSAATRKFPGEADFTFLVYPCDAVWGMRAAAERYYGFFPELFTKRVPRDGGSIHLEGGRFGAPAAAALVPPDVLDEYGVGYAWVRSTPIQQDPALMRYLRENRLLSIKHREPWARWHLVYPNPQHPWYDLFPKRRVDLSGIPPQPSTDEELAMLREETRMPANVLDGNDQIPGPVRDVAQATLNCLIYDEHDRPRITLWHRWSQGWHSQIPLNVDPDIPEPNRATMARRYQFPNMEGWGNPDANMANLVSWDSLTDWTGFHIEDFRRDNFQYLDEPLSFHYGTGRLMTLCGFHDFEMAQQWCREARAKGGYIMSNTEAQALLYCGQFLDLAGWERSPDNQSEEDMLLLRCLMDQKPCFLYRPGTEVGLRKMLAYGIYTADVPLPGGAGARGRAQEYRQLYLKYARRSIQIAAAGWQPVTYARAIPARPADDYRNGTRMKLLKIGDGTYYQSVGDTYETPNTQFSMERFGDGTKDLYFTLRSASDFRQAIVFVDLASLGLAKEAVKPVELIEGRSLVWDVQNGMMRIVLPITRAETLLLSLRA